MDNRQKVDILAREVDNLAQEVDKLAQISPYWQGNGEWHGICTLLSETQLRKIRQQRTLRTLR